MTLAARSSALTPAESPNTGRDSPTVSPFPATTKATSGVVIVIERAVLVVVSRTLPVVIIVKRPVLVPIEVRPLVIRVNLSPPRVEIGALLVTRTIVWEFLDHTGRLVCHFRFFGDRGRNRLPGG